MFESFASVLCLMHFRTLPWHGKDVQPGFDRIMHRDLKPENVFLTTADPRFWPEIPTAKVADWGFVIEQSDKEAHLPGVGTRGYQAPEQIYYPSGEFAGKYDASPASDIWSVGRIVMSLMNLEVCGGGGEDAMVEHSFETPGDFLPWRPGVEARYSKQLRKLVDYCLVKVPTERITADALWHAISNDVAKLRRHGQGPMKTSPRPAGEVYFYDDKYERWAR